MTAGPGIRGEELHRAACGVRAPGVVFALSCGGERTIATAGVVAVGAGSAVRAGPAVGAGPAVRAEDLHYELGSVSKTFAGLLVAQLVVAGSVERDTPVRSCLPAPGSGGPEGITLLHLATHTSGLPALPHDPFFYRQGLPRWRTNAYAGYPVERVLRAFGRHRARTPPGSRWRYSNLGMAVLGHALAHRTGTPYPELLARHVLRPLGLDGVRLGPGPPGVDAVGHGTRGRVVPPVDLGGFTAAGAVRATPHDLLTYLEAHLDPERTPLGAALRAVQVDHTAPRPRRAPARALAWFRADTARGPVFFHGGATFGQHAYLGYRPATRTALVAVATRRYTRRHNLIAVAHRVLVEAVG